MIVRLLQLNGVATLGVVFNHASGWGFTALFWWAHRYRPVTVPNFDQIGSTSYYGLRVIEQLVIVTIPIFLFVSGYFVAFATGRHRSTIDWKTVGNRIWYLLVPYVIWSLVIFGTEIFQGESASARQYGYRLLTGKATGAFYYVPLICQLYLLSPFIVRIAKWRWPLLLIGAGFIQILVEIASYMQLLGKVPAFLEPIMFLTQSWLFPSGIFWFSLGIVVGFNLKPFFASLHRVKRLLLVSLIALLILGIIEWEILLNLQEAQWLATRKTLLDNFFAAAFIFTLLAFEKTALPLGSQLGDLGSKSYGIYLTHSIVLEATARAIYVIAPTILAFQIIFQGILIAAGLGIPLLLMALANMHWFPPRRYYRYVFG